MDNIDTYMQRRIWDTEMEVLDVIDKVCRENGLKYSLAYGSMIGVVRHGGFIPWDDDMDIWMLREDYEKFIGIWENNPVDGYFLLRQERILQKFANAIQLLYQLGKKIRTTITEYL